MKRNSLSKEFLYDEIFKKKKSQKLVAAEFGCHVGTVERWMKNYGFTNRDDLRYAEFTKKYTYNDPMFCYLTGLFLTDGYSQRGHLQIRQNSNEVLLPLKEYFGGRIYHFKRHGMSSPQYELYLTKVPPQFLSLYTGKKTFSCVLPKVKYPWLLLRGIIDGDGTIRDKDIRIFTASNVFKDQLVELIQSLGFTPTILYVPTKKGNGWSVELKTQDVRIFAIKVYEGYEKLHSYKRAKVVSWVYDIVRAYKMINCKKWSINSPR